MTPRTLLPALALACLAPVARAQTPPATAPLVQCRSAVPAATPADCARWAARRQFFAQTACPDKHAATACKSFQELLRDSDPGLMSDFAHQDHVYVCFIPLDVARHIKDEFFKVTWSDPPAPGFSAPLPTQVKAGVPANALAAQGESDFSYFRTGVRDSDSSFHNSGNWIYQPAIQADLATMRMNADFRLAHFKAPNIDITSDEWMFTEIYRNDADTMTKHSVTVQLATGRFRQEFALADSGKIQIEQEGRCQIAPPGN